MPVDTDDTLVARSTQSELGRRAIEVIGYLLAVGIRLESRTRSNPAGYSEPNDVATQVQIGQED
jgi:hypothetical protein